MHLRRAGRPGFISFTATVLAVALAAGCGGGGGLEPPRDLSLREDFSECSGFTMNDEVATVDCPEGELRVLVRERVRAAVDGLAEDPRPPGSAKLAGHDDYRIRVGEYRMVYAVDDTERIVLVARIAHRREVYRR